MSQIKPYKRCKKCGAFIVSGELCEDCKLMTNADRIRQMTDEELAEMLLLSTCYFGCNKCKYHGKCKGKSCTEAALEWLKQEVSEDATD